ncbi:MAG: T9SS C-terminal target domain-containing protein, partial [Bacteroidia bacterium]|nr:T9SS C-terminal target domain-containing protein [Bacteroidia bacterium]
MKRILFTLMLVAGFLAATAQDTVRVSGTTGTVTWDASKVYVLEGYVRVDNGETLTIPAGTVVLADTGSQENASALIVERDGMIMAEGTAANPIIFSSVLDDVNDPADLLDVQARGLWGGIIVCGDASTNTANNGSEQVEGIPSTLPATVGTFGGNEDNDNSGIIRYVSIRHTGVALASNNEIQGLTLAGVGNGTTIEYVESYASDDDGIEIFGGTVNMRNIAIIFAADDMLDLDQGYRGKIQNLFIMQAADFGDRCGEWDGADSPEDGTPFAGWTISNATIIG